MKWKYIPAGVLLGIGFSKLAAGTLGNLMIEGTRFELSVERFMGAMLLGLSTLIILHK